MQVGRSKNGKKTGFKFTWKGNKTLAMMTIIILAGAGVYGHEKAHQMIGRKKRHDAP